MKEMIGEKMSFDFLRRFRKTRPPETHDHRQWTAEYVGSLAAWTTTTGDGGGWNKRQASVYRNDFDAVG